ncbi:MAG: hypothetical protein KJZ73_12985 [Pseudorhodoplanes sp.]|nr:hypothetical protein [Pseudorhodoplanes sp.]
MLSRRRPFAKRFRRFVHAAIAAALGISLAACASNGGKFATVAEFCKELPEQPTAIKGATSFDQPWIDDTSEAVLAGCPDRARPAPRPPEWDRPLAKHEPAKKRPGLLDRIRGAK